MQPHSIATINLNNARTPDQIKEAGGWAARFGKFAKGEKLPDTRTLACPRVRVGSLPVGHLKQKHIEHLEQNQFIASCCRHPENHEVEAFKSHTDEKAPDIYIFHCTCGRKHRFFCVGQTDPQRPVWNAA